MRQRYSNSLDPESMAKRLGLRPEWIRDQIKTGRLPAKRTATGYMLSIAETERLLGHLSQFPNPPSDERSIGDAAAIFLLLLYAKARRDRRRQQELLYTLQALGVGVKFGRRRNSRSLWRTPIDYKEIDRCKSLLRIALRQHVANDSDTVKDVLGLLRDDGIAVTIGGRARR